ncbi:MAG TPA: hypothetical protein VHT91_48630 [Kofleriaceae bacterium]|jgi:hypothetical protein|nr:hypothetical protein [Kofleriaceae bacterium]
MHGYYYCDVSMGPMAAPSLSSGAAWGGGPKAAVFGGRWVLQDVEGFSFVGMSDPGAGGATTGRQGVKTEGLSGCIVIAAMQQDEEGAWERYYFAHLKADEWDYDAVNRRQEFRKAIPHPERAFLLIVNQGMSTSKTIVRAVQWWGTSVIPDERTTVYSYIEAPRRFAMQFYSGAVGEF